MKTILVETSAEAYKEAMSKRAERLKKEQFVKEKRLKEVMIIFYYN